MSKQSQRQRDRGKYQAPAKQGLAALALLYYAEPGQSLVRLADPAGPRDLGHYLESFIDAVDVWAKNAWEQLGNAQRRGHIWVYPATSYAQYLLPQKVRDEAEQRIVPQLLRSVLAAAPHDVSGKCGDDDGEFRVRVVFLPLSFGSIPIEHAEFAMLRPAVPLLQRLIGDPDAGTEAKLALEALANFIPEAAAALVLANKSETGQVQWVTSPAEQLQADLVSRLKKLIPTLSSEPAQKAQEVLALNRDLNRAYWEELRGELVPLFKVLLSDIPSDYDGKKTRAACVNGLLSALHLTIVMRDDHGRAHRCSLYAVRARDSDLKGNLRLLEKTRTGSSQKSYPIPSPDKLEVIETPHQEADLHPQQSRTGPGA
jgi:hypothetical protein